MAYGRDMSEVIRRIGIRADPLSADELYEAVSDPEAGGIVTFVGTVRRHDAGRSVTQLAYDAHPTAIDVLRQVAEKVAADVPVLAVAVEHRVGVLEIGDIAVVVAVAAEHRGEAFTAAQRLIDDLKSTVPIWKRQDFTDGGQEWVGTP
jgi:molybdopterin synthase catalytic subunit